MTNKKMRSIGEFLKEERHRLGMSQAEFAAVGGLNPRTLIRYEQNDASPDGAYLQSLAKIGVDVQYVLTGVRVISVVADDEQKLLSMYRSLDYSSKNGIWGMMNGILSTQSNGIGSNADSNIRDDAYRLRKSFSF